MSIDLQYDDSIEKIINTYNNVLKVMDSEAHYNTTRSYGGIIRSNKGKLQEYITHSLIQIAWDEIGGSSKRIKINSKKINIPLNINKYLDTIEQKEVKEYIKNNISEYSYGLSVDKHVYIDGKFVMGIECKSYTENAMLKRIMVDFNLISTMYPDISCYLIQLESHLGGDYSELNEIDYGSYSTHTIMSYFDIRLNIITLLEGERDILNPIHKSYKELRRDRLIKTKDILMADLRQYL